MTSLLAWRWFVRSSCNTVTLLTIRPDGRGDTPTWTNRCSPAAFPPAVTWLFWRRCWTRFDPKIVHSSYSGLTLESPPQLPWQRLPKLFAWSENSMLTPNQMLVLHNMWTELFCPLRPVAQTAPSRFTALNFWLICDFIAIVSVSLCGIFNVRYWPTVVVVRNWQVDGEVHKCLTN